ncbi:protein phosphatase [Fibrisoma limi BUZ 3]|uniref:Protein phosphatase n=1 Tax=Fibrisoma limi BUZ 3 TaxID=1185876 RepID=I2GM41_9BACT|nr:protein phosphatase 2C domain-containing protein [Fibrisoma limi]CCH54967.1 protein phosphatase [Fibrisoma limi BUZ 3]
MEVLITPPIGFTRPGSRSNNEDTLFPNPERVDPDQRWFLVCDGVGGAERGEVASQLAAAQFDRYFRNHPVTVVTEQYIQQALNFVHDCFDDYVAANAQAKSMGTTLTLVYRHDAGVTVAHLGDSRVYLIRDGAIQWRTSDHSYVNELVQSGVLTADEARLHPQRNIITRAIQAGHKRAQADVQLLNDLRPNDYLFMCTDGILERISDELLEKILGSDDSNAEKINTLLACCNGHTRDNFTAYLIQIAAVRGDVQPASKIVLPIYTRPEATEPDDAVTLIGVPRPEPSVSYAYSAALASVDAVAPVHGKVDTPDQPVLQKQPSISKPGASGSARWLWVMVVILVCGGSYGLWWRFGQSRTREPDALRAPKVAVSSLPERPEPVAKPPMVAPVAEKADETSQGKKPADSQDSSDDSGLKVVQTLSRMKLEVVQDKQGKLGLRRTGGRLVFSPQFEQVKLSQFKWGLIPVTIDDSPKVISQQGKIYDLMGNPSQSCGMIPVRRGDWWGYVNLDGYELIAPRKYITAQTFEEDNNCTAEVTDQQGKTYRINRKGQQLPNSPSSTPSPNETL